MSSKDWGDPALRGQFLLDPDMAFLNHGSFGACPIPVLARQGQLRTELEREPVAFLHRRLPDCLAEARAALAAQLGAAPRQLVYQPNVTVALNVAIRSLPLAAGDEVLVGDHEYGALLRCWEAEAGRRGLCLRRVALPLPVRDAARVTAAYERAASPATRAIFLSHISSPTALRLPIDALLDLARRRGWISVVDGAHAPGQIPLDLGTLGADIYAGNCHKWLLAPKGCGFLWAGERARDWIRPLVVSWGHTNRPPAQRRDPFLDELEWSGTCDPTAWLALPAALEFRRAWHWEERAAACREHLQAWGDRLEERFGARRLGPRDEGLQMLALGLPPAACPAHRAAELHERLFAGSGVEVPLFEFQGEAVLRLSLQPYNREADLERLERALGGLLEQAGPSA
ncbi:MAG: aminotransferase class V-fold PLP-dependent enzyme [bacterium]|jgi:isopenicillin-N epimerase|nr:aminotransferase class V-fold PLP-dependent enzyme [bacterium]